MVRWVFEGTITGRSRVTLPADERERRQALDALIQRVMSHLSGGATAITGGARVLEMIEVPGEVPPSWGVPR